MYFKFDTRIYTAPGYCVMEHVDLKRCGRRGSDVLHSEHKLLLRCMGVLSIACVVHVAGAVHIHACIYCSLLHACAYAGPLFHSLSKVRIFAHFLKQRKTGEIWNI